MQVFKSRVGAVVAGAAVLALATGGGAAFAEKGGNPTPPGHDRSPALQQGGGLTGYEVRSWDYATVSGGGFADMGCSTGKVPLGGGYQWKDEEVAMTKGLSVVVDMPGRMDWTTNTPDPTKPGWIIRPNKPANVNPGALTVYVICADGS